MIFRKITYRGWENSIEMVNDSVRVVVSPKIGRIIHYSFKDEENLLWINPVWEGKLLTDVYDDPTRPDVEWANFGGDKVWPMEQSRWPRVNGRAWPPDPWFDGSPHDTELLPDGVRLISPVSRFCGARIIREMTLEKSSPSVRIRQTLEKVHPSQHPEMEPLPMTIWSVTQIPKPDEILLSLNPRSLLVDQVIIFDDSPVTRSNFVREKGVGIFKPSDHDHQKIGTDGDRWIAAILGKFLFVQLFKREEDATFPDGGLSIEAYTAPSPDSYAELELLSPLQYLKPGETLQWEIRWKLQRIVRSDDKDLGHSEAMKRVNAL